MSDTQTPTRSRFSTGVTPHDLPIHPAVQAIGAYTDALHVRDAGAISLLVPGEYFARRIIVEASPPGRYGKQPRVTTVTISPPLSFNITHKSQYSGKRWRSRLRGAETLDSFFTGGDAWSHASEDQIWQAACEFVEDYGEHELAKPVDVDPTQIQFAPPYRLTPFSAVGYPLAALINLALIHRAGGVSVRLENVTGLQ